MHLASQIMHSRAVLSRVPPDPAARKHSKTMWARASRDALETGTHSIPPAPTVCIRRPCGRGFCVLADLSEKEYAKKMWILCSAIGHNARSVTLHA